MSPGAELVRARVWHGRKGDIGNAFLYAVDYLLIDPEDPTPLPWPLRRDRAGLVTHYCADHGIGDRQGVDWVREQVRAAGLAAPARILLLTHPRVLGHGFNPVSFWFCLDDLGNLRAVLAEVTNTWKDRCAYLLHHPDHGPLTRGDELAADKAMHVSPFQPLTGRYRFRFDLQADRLGVRIDYDRDGGGLVATLTGRRAPLTRGAVLGALLRGRFGARRVLALIHWQALVLWRKGARWHSRPT